MEAAKEKILNVNATALSGLNKVKATTQEKVEKMTTSDPMKKENAEMRKGEKIREAEAEKQRAFNENAIHKEQLSHTGIGGQAAHQSKLGVQPGMGGARDHAGMPNDVGTRENPVGHVADIHNMGVQTAAGAKANPTAPVGGVNPSEHLTGVQRGGVQTAANPTEQVDGINHAGAQTATSSRTDQAGHETGGRIY
ncbi:18 kDa seed maturation protein [Platanthera zijinensis]|uniref:18 kDa seed maturation protein n=1 Tax=Platanthera zijinensis TaxID=2320716 RepID=A0AAP0BIY2_9ASPA